MKYMTVYLADDDTDDREIFSWALEDISNDVHLATFKDGQQLINELNTAWQNKPDVIFLDINMPLKNGIEVLSDLKSNPVTSKIPVVMYSTSADPNLIATTKSLGANLYFVKPSDYTRLKKLLLKTLSINWNDFVIPQAINDFMIT